MFMRSFVSILRPRQTPNCVEWPWQPSTLREEPFPSRTLGWLDTERLMGFDK